MGLTLVSLVGEVGIVDHDSLVEVSGYNFKSFVNDLGRCVFVAVLNPHDVITLTSL